MSTSATYTQLRDGSWGIRVQGEAKVNQSVVVAKKDGTTKMETVAKVLWTGRDSKSGATVSLCAITGTKSGPTKDRAHCVVCGSRLDQYAQQRGYRRCLDCVDGGGGARGGQSYYDRHGNFVLGDDD